MEAKAGFTNDDCSRSFSDDASSYQKKCIVRSHPMLGRIILVVAGLASKKRGINFLIKKFIAGFPLMILSILISTIYTYH
ncbi:hypothetical protein H839_01551 [Parageobacillus genomosp. 1]|uniref:Uncharacterized protein n=1 Tax=Parageobacillus genomosp. 1 TaxID=1295642 RepID=A0ABC9VI43_9BACL|nr:hypothetical protein H839_01551 [Parageobacillus genomosp. 1]